MTLGQGKQGETRPCAARNNIQGIQTEILAHRRRNVGRHEGSLRSGPIGNYLGGYNATKTEMFAVDALPFAFKDYQVGLWKKRRRPLRQLFPLQRTPERENLPERAVHRGEN